MMKILLVEDDTEISEMLKNFLMTENFEVVTAYDGESACEKFFADTYSIVLLDLMIPKISGMQAKAKQVMDLIDQFFTLAKLEAGDKNIEMVKINICELCRENVLGYYELLMQKNFVVDIVIPEQTIFVQGDKESIDRILCNLLTNAIRYGSDGKYVGLFLREEKDFVYIDVIDKGKGIEKQFAASVFERLYTMEDSRNRSIQGNGLGLTIARNLARQMGGDILLQSEPKVQTVFTVKLRKLMKRQGDEKWILC